jgi:hypothetical protein
MQVGCAAMLLAAKMEERHIPEIDDFIFFMAHAYTTYEVSRTAILCRVHGVCMRGGVVLLV